MSVNPIQGASRGAVLGPASCRVERGRIHSFPHNPRNEAREPHYAERFGSRRYIHRAELRSQPDAEVVIDGEAPIQIAPEFLIVPTPGHTAGHCVLLFRQRFLFTGDHLAWDRDGKQLEAYPDYCWYSWKRQIESMRHLAEFSFEWMLPRTWPAGPAASQRDAATDDGSGGADGHDGWMMRGELTLTSRARSGKDGATSLAGRASDGPAEDCRFVTPRASLIACEASPE